MIAWLRRFPSILPLALLLIVVLTSCTTIRRDELDREAPPGPGQAARLLRMGTDALAAGDPATAAALFARVLVLEPGNREAARRLGEAALRSGRYEEAIEAYRRLVDSDVNDVEAARGMAKALLALGRPEAALARLEPALQAQPEDTRLLNLLGVTLDQLGRHEEAQARYRAALARTPEDAALRNNLGLSLLLAGRYAEAIRELESVARGPQSSPRARHNLAAAYALSGDPAAAEELLRFDLTPREIRDNLAFYQTLRGLGASASLRAARALLPERALRGTLEPEWSPRQPLLGSLLDERALGGSGRSRARIETRAGPSAAAASAVQQASPSAPGREEGQQVTATSEAAWAAAAALGQLHAPASPSPSPDAAAGASAEREDASARADVPQSSALGQSGEGEASSMPAGVPVGSTREAPAEFVVVGGSEARAASADSAAGETWVIEIAGLAGADGRARWQALRSAHPELLAGVARLGGAEDEGAPLLIGPFPDLAAAEQVCARLREKAHCRALRL